MFKCKACPSHEKHIADLQEQIGYLRTLIFPKVDMYNPPLIQREADAILSGSNQPLEVAKSQAKESKAMHEIDPEDPSPEEIIAERDRILSGTY